MSSIFSKIVSGDIPCYKIAEDSRFFAFLDINPLAEGHTLVIPKQETDYLFDLDDELYKDLFLFSKKIALAIKKAIPCKKIGIAVVGLEVAHAHIHLVPLNGIYDIDFKKPKLSFSKEEFEQISSRIKQALDV
ncbi:MAG TPA: HIT family protein [Bacteroidales bacterium]|nr:HIT family protein [Bacteroidales bacterium]